LPVLRFHRDKRGYEYFSLVEPGTSGGGRRGRSGRLLYWFRTPPNVKLGREPFDEERQRSLEAQYPDVRFDWRRILATPIPSADDEMWRERRRAAKAAKLAAKDEDDTEDPAPLESPEPPEAPERAEGLENAQPFGPLELAEAPASEAVALEAPVADAKIPDQAAGPGPRRRRRRRRGGGGRGSEPGPASAL